MCQSFSQKLINQQLYLLKQEGPSLANYANFSNQNPIIIAVNFNSQQIKTNERCFFDISSLRKINKNVSLSQLSGFTVLLLKMIHEDNSKEILLKLKKFLYNEKLQFQFSLQQNEVNRKPDLRKKYHLKLLVQFFHIMNYTRDAIGIENHINKYPIIIEILSKFFEFMAIKLYPSHQLNTALKIRAICGWLLLNLRQFGSFYLFQNNKYFLVSSENQSTFGRIKQQLKYQIITIIEQSLIFDNQNLENIFKFMQILRENRDQKLQNKMGIQISKANTFQQLNIQFHPQQTLESRQQQTSRKNIDFKSNNYQSTNYLSQAFVFKSAISIEKKDQKDCSSNEIVKNLQTSRQRNILSSQTSIKYQRQRNLQLRDNYMYSFAGNNQNLLSVNQQQKTKDFVSRKDIEKVIKITSQPAMIFQNAKQQLTNRIKIESSRQLIKKKLSIKKLSSKSPVYKKQINNSPIKQENRQLIISNPLKQENGLNSSSGSVSKTYVGCCNNYISKNFNCSLKKQNQNLKQLSENHRNVKRLKQPEVNRNFFQKLCD